MRAGSLALAVVALYAVPAAYGIRSAFAIDFASNSLRLNLAGEPSDAGMITLAPRIILQR
jgi:hypothetical protein